MTTTENFSALLRASSPDPAGRRWIFVPYDQLTDRIGPLSRARPADLGIVLVEAPWKAARRPYHKQKLALVLANMRHFALEQARRGVAVRYVTSKGSYADALAPLARELGRIEMMEAAERELRIDLAPLVSAGSIVVVPHEGWLTTRAQFLDAVRDAPPWRMDAFYRHVRRETGVLMQGGKPIGGRFSFDGENRARWKGTPSAPTPPRFEPGAITREVGALVETRFADHPGRLDLTSLPTTSADAQRLWSWAKTECLENFGPFEDAMSTRSTGLFHTRVSPLVNLHRFLPRDVVSDVLTLDIPLASREGFVRQVLGWREFVHHVHVATDGFRTNTACASPHSMSPNSGAEPSFLGARDPLPAAYWGAPSGLACLDRVVKDVLDGGWSHHITRLMVLANIATLLDVSPRELTDWFWAMYVDAFDWVVEPNVLAMGTFAVGETMTTKPYVAGSAYIDKMSDYCATCAFTPGKDCPLTALYWDFLARHEAQLADNQRIAMPIRSMQKRSAAKKRADHATFELVRATLAAGATLTPDAPRARAADRPTEE